MPYRGVGENSDPYFAVLSVANLGAADRPVLSFTRQSDPDVFVARLYNGHQHCRVIWQQVQDNVVARQLSLDYRQLRGIGDDVVSKKVRHHDKATRSFHAQPGRTTVILSLNHGLPKLQFVTQCEDRLPPRSERDVHRHRPGVVFHDRAGRNSGRISPCRRRQERAHHRSLVTEGVQLGTSRCASEHQGNFVV